MGSAFSVTATTGRSLSEPHFSFKAIPTDKLLHTATIHMPIGLLIEPNILIIKPISENKANIPYLLSCIYIYKAPLNTH